MKPSPCRTCRFAVEPPTEEGTPAGLGFCYRHPPQMVFNMAKQTSESCFPPIDLDKSWCGEHEAKPVGVDAGAIRWVGETPRGRKGGWFSW